MTELISTKELFLKQYHDNKLQRYDVVVRYIATEHYMKTNELHPIYEIDCKKRSEYIDKNPSISIPKSKQNFIDTIESLKKVGFDPEKGLIEVCNDYIIYGGAHRLGACLYLRIPKVKVEFTGKDSPVDKQCQNIEYIKKAYSNEKELLELILRKEKEIKKIYKIDS